MSNYTPSTNFATKDALVSGNPAKIIKGTEISAEFNAIQTAIASKYDSASTVPVSAGGTGATNATDARTNLGVTVANIGAAASGANTDITSLSGLTGAVTGPTSLTGATAGMAVSNVTSINGGQLAGLRNRIINGDMRIDQRNAGAAITPTGSTFSADRFAAIITQASKLTFQQVADAPAGLKNSLKITVASQYSPLATDSFCIQHGIEGQNLIDFGFGTASPATVTLSFWIKGSVAGTYGLCLNSSNNGRQYVGTVSVTSSWVRQTITLVGDTTGTYNTDNSAGLFLQFDLGSGTNFNGTAGTWQSGAQLRRTSGCVTFVNQTAGATLNITGVQLEVGSVATPFEHRPYGMELAMCQWYLRRFRSDLWWNVSASATQVHQQCYSFPMRDTPNVSIITAGTLTNATESVVVSGTGQSAAVIHRMAAVGTGQMRAQDTLIQAEKEL